jgi:adenylosuccinate synthase
VFEAMPGWKCSISNAGTFQGLPPNAQAYVHRVEELLGVPVKLISVGPKREAMIVR